MARKSSPPPEPKPAQLTPAQIKAGIPKLKRRLGEIEEFKPEEMQKSSDPIASALHKKIDSTLVDVFGHDTLEYRRYQIRSLYAGGLRLGGVSRGEIVDGFNVGKQRALSSIRTAIETLEEQLEDVGATTGSGAPSTLEGFELHPTIISAVGPLYRDGHYANAVETACKVLNNLVQNSSGVFDKDNTELMLHVFSANSPILAFNELKDDTDKSEQQGMMHLYQGVCLAFRNPRAHKLLDDDSELAFGMIHFVSFLAKLLEKTRKI
ncbi:MAG: TIGR02391 family protein [Thermodesulfobacteriota bacterium]